MEVSNIEIKNNRQLTTVIIIQIIHSSYESDVIGRKFEFDENNRPSGQWTYLVGQDKP
jgi:hypothetical protein